MPHYVTTYPPPLPRVTISRHASSPPPRATVQPHMPVCLLADVPMIASLREHFFLRPQGLPFLSPNLEPRYTRSLPPAAQEALPEDWKVVVFLRRGKKRAMWSNREFFKGVRGVFEKERIRVLKAHLGLSAGEPPPLLPLLLLSHGFFLHLF